MDIDLKTEFKKVEDAIKEHQSQNKDATGLLRKKTRLLMLGYTQMSEAMQKGELPKIAHVFADELAYLNNVKKIQKQINESTAETDSEIEKVHAQMRECGFGWIIDNLPERKK